MGLKQIYEDQDLQTIIEQDSHFILFKHSLTCPISQGAFEQFHEYLSKHSEINGYYLTVQESRSLSNDIADQYRIKHESPQIFYIKNGVVQWHTSHQKITVSAIEEVVNN